MKYNYYDHVEKFLKSYGLVMITGIIDDVPIILNDEYIEFQYSLN